MSLVCSEIVTKSNLESRSPQPKLTLRVMVERVLRSVISRKPKAYQPHPEQAPQYLLAYVTEELECGHSLDVHFVEAVEPLIAKRRSCPECASLPRKKPVQSVRLVSKKAAGFLTWGSGAVALVTAVLLISAVVKGWPKSYFYTYPTNYLRVMQRLNDSDFLMQRVEAGLAQETTMMRFCNDAKLPWFEGGHTLGWIRYNDMGSCQSIGPENRGFDVVRDSKGLPVLAPNCHFDWSTPNGHVVGPDGKPCQPKFD